MSLRFNALQESHRPSATGNIARHLPALAHSAGNGPAITVSRREASRLRYHSISYAELDRLSCRFAHGLSLGGVSRGDRTLLMVRQGIDFVALVFALFRIGAVPVLIDPGMGIARLLECIRPINLDAFVGIPLAQAVRTLRPGPFATVKTFVTVGRRWFWGGPTLSQLTAKASDDFAMVSTVPDDTAAILFTSGSTGPAKGVVYTHGMFDAQVRMIQSTYGIQPGEVDLPTFPLFALFSVAMGMTIVLPDMDPSHPAKVNPWNIIHAIRDQKVTSTFGSPALWKRVAACCTESHLIRLPTLRRILIAGAPVPPNVIAQLHRVLSPDADVHTPYGATESLPVSTISGSEVVARETESRPSGSGREVLSDRDDARCISVARREANPETSPTVAQTLRGAGTCVGRPVDGTSVRIIRITDDPITSWSDEFLSSPGQVGEIAVSGPSITREYFNMPLGNASSKIMEGATVWHRIGDVGYFDELGRLWFCGRKAHRVQTAAGTLFTECIEPIVNQHPAVTRSALVGIGPVPSQSPVLIVEPRPGQPHRGPRSRALAVEIFGFMLDQTPAAVEPQVLSNRPTTLAAQQVALLQDQVKHRTPTRRSPILFHRSLPVDIRHNAKINREQLAQWAAQFH